MLKVINFLRGNVEIEIESVFPERILNVCSQNKIPFWGLTWLSPQSLRIKMQWKSYRRLCARSKNLMCTITVVSRKGVPFFLRRFRKRYALIVGMLIFIAMVSIGSLFIWDIDVSGNERVSDAEILVALEKRGVGIGTFGPSIDPEAIKHHILLDIDGLSWITVNLSGSRAHVLVRERTAPPEIIDESIATNLIATRTGIITRMEVYNGSAQFEPGDTVLKGELLVSGVVDTPTVGVRFVHAEGKVFARTWYEISAQTPLAAVGKSYTGRESTRWAMILWGKRINFYLDGRISFDDYDKIRKKQEIKVSNGMTLPIALISEKYREYEPMEEAADRAAAEEALRRALDDRLRLKIGDGEILDAQYTATEQNGLLKISLLAECEEQIAVMIAMPEEEWVK